MISLEDFVKQALLDICRGVQAANDAMPHGVANPAGMRATAIDFGDLGRVVNMVSFDNADDVMTRFIASVKFDVAVTASESAEGKAGAKVDIKVFSIGGDGAKKQEHSTVSRIAFMVPCQLPQGMAR